jgi:predicted SnoaL-like aldol condensation-catalyzing enzyme
VREGAPLAPKKRPDARPKIGEDTGRLLEADLEEYPAATLADRLLKRVAEAGASAGDDSASSSESSDQHAQRSTRVLSSPTLVLEIPPTKVSHEKLVLRPTPEARFPGINYGRRRTLAERHFVLRKEEHRMSLEENKSIVRRIYDELWNERKLEVADEVIAAEGFNYDTGLTPVPGGPEDMKQTVRMVTAGFPDNYHAVEEMIAEGDRVVARVTFTATHEGEFMGIAPTGRRIAITEIHIYRLEDGKAVEHRVGRDDLGAMRQLGVISESVPAPGPPRSGEAGETRESKHSQDAEPAVVLREMIMGFRMTQLIFVAARLGIADLLAAGAQRAEDLAERAGAHPPTLYRLLRALASIGLLSETAGHVFELTTLGRVLQSEAPGSLRGMALLYGDEWLYRAYGALLYSVQTGKPAFEHVHGMGFFEYLEQNAQAASIFNDAMTAFSRQEEAAILAAYDFSRFTRIVDVGGGHGSLLAAVLGAYPNTEGILFDLPSVVEGAPELLARSGVAQRCQVARGDFFDQVPAGGDAYILKRVIHDWDDEQSVRILRNCRAAMTNEARLLVSEGIVPSGGEPSEAKLFDINMLVSCGALERTEQEYADLLDAAGFEMTRVIPTQSPLSLIESRPKDAA